MLTLHLNSKINKTLHSQAVSHQVINGGRCLDGEKCLCEKAAELVISEEGKDISVVERVILEFDMHRGAKSRVWTKIGKKYKYQGRVPFIDKLRKPLKIQLVSKNFNEVELQFNFECKEVEPCL